jgi:hypothetical protein
MINMSAGRGEQELDSEFKVAKGYRCKWKQTRQTFILFLIIHQVSTGSNEELMPLAKLASNFLLQLYLIFYM